MTKKVVSLFLSVVMLVTMVSVCGLVLPIAAEDEAVFTIVGNKKEVYRGETVTFTISNMTEALNIAVFQANSSGNPANYTPQFGYTASIAAGTTSCSIAVPATQTPGNYVAAMWNGSSGWSSMKESKFAFTVLDTYPVYLDTASANETETGSFDTPYKSFAAAVNAVNAADYTGARTIVVKNVGWNEGNLDFSSCNAWDEMITIRDIKKDTIIWTSSGTIKTNGPLTLDAPVGNTSGSGPLSIYTRGYDFVLGELFYNRYYADKGASTTVYAGYDSAEGLTADASSGRIELGRNNNLTIQGTATQKMTINYGHAEAGASVVYGDAHLYINNPNLTIETLDIGLIGNGTDTEARTRFNNLDIRVDNVAAINLFQVNSWGGSVHVNNTLQAIFNNGTYDKINSFNTGFGWKFADYKNNGFVSSKHYVLKSAATAGSSLQLTDTAGTYTVAGDVQAVALGSQIYTSTNNQLTLGAVGEYEVIYDNNFTPGAYYVDFTNGSNENSGLTAASAFKTLSPAITAAQSTEVKTVVIIGAYTDTYSGAFPANTVPVTIKGYDVFSSLDFITTSGRSYNVTLNGPLKFENLTINGNDKVLTTEGHSVTFGKGLTVNGLTVKIGSENKNLTTASKVEFHSGTYDSIYVGTYFNYSRNEMAGTEVYFGEDAETKTFKIGSDKAADGSGVMRDAGVDFIGDIKITLEGSVTGSSEEALSLTSGASTPRFKQGFSLIYNNGAAANKEVLIHSKTVDEIKYYDTAVFTAAAGSWTMKADTGIYLYEGDTLGTFRVKDNALVVAENTVTKKKYRSNSGKLVVPAGVYTVTAHTEGTQPLYNVYDDKVEVLEDGTEIRLAGLVPADQAGKAFVGWVDAKGNRLAAVAQYEAGDVLIPQYVEFNNSVGGDFSIVGVQMRTTNPQGLRFIIQQGDDFTAKLEAQLKTMYGESFQLQRTNSGAIALPSTVLHNNTTDDGDGDGRWTSLLKGATYTYGGKTYEPAEIWSEKTFAWGENYRQYTICLTNLSSPSLYKRQYTVRGWIEYTVKYEDETEETIVVYTDEYSTNLVAVAEATLLENSTARNAVDMAVLRQVITDAREHTKTKYETGNYTTQTPLSGAQFPASGMSFYQQESGLIVRDIVIDSDDDELNNTPENATTIVQLSDLHLYYMKGSDFQNATLVGTEEARTWTTIKEQNNLPKIRKALEYAFVADQIVISGDVIDVLQEGALEIVRKEITERFPEVLLLNGNHDVVQRSQTWLGESYDLDTRYQMLNDAWGKTYKRTSNGLGGIGDVSYASKTVDDVMIIQMDNGTPDTTGLYGFAEGTAAKLEADLNKARQEGNRVLIFTHVPLTTGNSTETAVLPFYQGDNSGAEDFYQNSNKALTGTAVYVASDTGETVTLEASEATQAVMNLIKTNGDVIRAVFNGHTHSDYYTQIIATDSVGNAANIPQYTMNGTTYSGDVTKITVYTDAPTLTVNKSKLVYGEVLKVNFSDIAGVVEFGLLPCDDDGNILASAYKQTSIIGYKRLALSDTSHTIDTNWDIPNAPAGKYMACLWSTGWKMYDQIPITISDGTIPQLSVSGTEFTAGKGTITLTSDVAATDIAPLEMGLYLTDENGRIDITAQLGTTAFPARAQLLTGETSAELDIPTTPGNYKAVLWSTGHDIHTAVDIVVNAPATAS